MTHHTATGPTAYVLGHSADEQRRLDVQGAQLRPFTERLLRDAGIRPGLRVLDVGCGTGDVALLAAELVAPTGRVIAIDRSPEVLETARARAEARGVGGRGRLEFREQEITTLTTDGEPFDAIVGRNVLMHQPDAAAVVRRLARLARPGGLVVFAEPVVVAPPLVAPEDRPLAARCVAWVVQALQGAGLRTDFGLWLYATFVAAGLPAPTLRIDGVLFGGADVGYAAWLAATVQTLLPLIERLGIATATEAEIDTLAERLLAEAGAAGGAWCGYLQGAAWARVPERDDARSVEPRTPWWLAPEGARKPSRPVLKNCRKYAPEPSGRRPGKVE